MIGDPLILTQKNYYRAKLILPELINSNIILIGGGSGTSKSELAYCIQKELWDKKKSSFVISLDDYYVTLPGEREQIRKKKGIESVGLSEIDWTSVDRIYNDFNNKRITRFHRTHRFLNEIEFNTILTNFDSLIIEGLYANYIRKTKNDNYSIFLEGNPSQTLAFRKLRGKENEINAFRTKVVQKEFNVCSQLKKYADLILPYENI